MKQNHEHNGDVCFKGN